MNTSPETLDEDRLHLDGPAVLADDELLALLWDEGRDVSRRILERAGGLRALAAWTIPELASHGALGDRRASALAAAFEIGRRSEAERRRRGSPLSSSFDVYRHFRPILRDERRENFMVALLDVKNRLLRDARVSVGSLSASLVHPRE
ncbi:MAG TPA: JAB domain-containing protein, partial [bacterium]|nr:JAB domain-containing protein [bacterium]